MQLSATIKGAAGLQKRLVKDRQQENRNLFTALRVAGFRLRKVMQNEIRVGAPGGKRFEGRRFISPGARNRVPLRRMAIAVRYWTRRNPDEVHVGFSGPRLSSRWKHLASMHQEGFTTDPDARTSFAGLSARERLRRHGAALSKRSKYRKYYFLKKSTKQLRTPARPIVGPFWRRHESTAWKMVRTNFRRKMAGRRI